MVRLGVQISYYGVTYNGNAYEVKVEVDHSRNPEYKDITVTLDGDLVREDEDIIEYLEDQLNRYEF